MQIERERQRVVLLRCPLLGELLAARLEVSSNAILDNARVVPIAIHDPLLEVRRGEVGRHRDAARYCQAVPLATSRASQRDDASLQMSERGRYRVALVGSADHNQTLRASWISDAE